uniref:Metal dependent phosphohydrolase n=1 Tax=Geobacter sp. (strain M21) TaxID=443144 RepID=C6E2X8_GEOSM
MFALFVACALLPVCALALLSLRQVAENTRNESRVLLRHTSKNAAMAIHQVLLMLQTDLRAQASSAAGMPSVSGGDERQRVKTSAQERFQAVTMFSGQKARNIFGDTCPTPPLTAATRKHLADGNMLMFFQETGNGPSRIFIATSLDNNPERFLLVGEVKASYLWEVVGYTVPPRISICILDPAGKALFSSVTPVPAFIDRVKTELRRSTIGGFEARQEKRSYLVSYWQLFLESSFCAAPLTVVTSQSTHDAYLSFGKFAHTFYLVVSLTLLVVIFISSRQIRRNLLPLTILKEGAQQISQGDFDHKVTIDSDDEFARLADSFNEMSDHLKMHFYILTETSLIVRKVLSGRNNEEIVEAVLTNLHAIIPCDWVCVSLMHPMIKDMTVNFSSRCAPENSAAIKQSVAVLKSQEMSMLHKNVDSLEVAVGGKQFSAFLAPIAEEGARDAFLVPVFFKKSLYAVLTLGYRQKPEHVREDLLRARQIADQIAIALENVRLIEELNLLNLGTIRALANAVDAKSPWTSGHSLRVTNIALNIGKELGLSAAELETLHRGGLFHDIGKIGVPESILDKPGKLTEEEFVTIRKHPEIGVEIISPVEAYRKLIPIVLQHHEWFNGNGYPNGLAGDAISPLARILAVADVYDALISDRPYRQGWEFEQVMSYLEKSSGTQFDPVVIQAVLSMKDRGTLESSSLPYQETA